MSEHEINVIMRAIGGLEGKVDDLSARFDRYAEDLKEVKKEIANMKLASAEKEGKQKGTLASISTVWKVLTGISTAVAGLALFLSWLKIK